MCIKVNIYICKQTKSLLHRERERDGDRDLFLPRDTDLAFLLNLSHREHQKDYNSDRV